MIRKKNQFSRPQKPFEAGRIKEENELREKYGLKNKREIWKAIAIVNYYRGRAKDLAKKDHSEQKVLFNKLNAIGIKVESIAEILDLKVTDVLERRLATVVAKKKIANTPKQARQWIVHKRIKIDGKVVSAPSYLVPVALEHKITLKAKAHKPKAQKEDIPTEEESQVENLVVGEEGGNE